MSIGCAVVTGVPRPGLAAQCVWGALRGYLMRCNTGDHIRSILLASWLAPIPADGAGAARSRLVSSAVDGKSSRSSAAGPGHCLSCPRRQRRERRRTVRAEAAQRIRRPGERHEWQQKRLDRFEREIAALRRLDLSPNIPSVVDSYVGSKGASFVTPYGQEPEKRCATSSSRKQYCNSYGGSSRQRSSPTTEKLCTAI